MITDGFDSPVGTALERRTRQIFPGRWIVANAYGNYYTVVPGRDAFHTGVDLNLPEDRDAHAPIYAIAHGTVTYARTGGGTWGKLIVVEHTLPSDAKVYSRYAHVEAMLVREGQQVKRGNQIATIGNAGGRFPYHLHFDISTTRLLRTNPEDWPGINEVWLKRHYVNPCTFIKEHRPMTAPDEFIRAAQTQLDQVKSLLDQALTLLAPPPAVEGLPEGSWRAEVSDSLRVRKQPGVNTEVIGGLVKGETLVIAGDTAADGYHWAIIVQGKFAGGYVAKEFLNLLEQAIG